jgi:hypothetical protein
VASPKTADDDLPRETRGDPGGIRPPWAATTNRNLAGSREDESHRHDHLSGDEHDQRREYTELRTQLCDSTSPLGMSSEPASSDDSGMLVLAA